jgi:hypothetical protein
MPVGIMIEEHAELRTPVSGRIGDRRASRGNLVPDGTSGHTILLAAIEPIDPIHFGSIFEDASYVRHARFFKNSGDAADHGFTSPIKHRLIQESALSHEDETDFVDNAIVDARLAATANLRPTPVPRSTQKMLLRSLGLSCVDKALLVRHREMPCEIPTIRFPTKPSPRQCAYHADS